MRQFSPHNRPPVGRHDSVASNSTYSGSGAPPPCYTSQRDTASSICAVDLCGVDVHGHTRPAWADLDADDAYSGWGEPNPRSSELYRDIIDLLPSPYSTENLLANADTAQGSPSQAHSFYASTNLSGSRVAPSVARENGRYSLSAPMDPSIPSTPPPPQGYPPSSSPFRHSSASISAPGSGGNGNTSGVDDSPSQLSQKYQKSGRRPRYSSIPTSRPHSANRVFRDTSPPPPLPPHPRMSTSSQLTHLTYEPHIDSSPWATTEVTAGVRASPGEGDDIPTLDLPPRLPFPRAPRSHPHSRSQPDRRVSPQDHRTTSRSIPATTDRHDQRKNATNFVFLSRKSTSIEPSSPSSSFWGGLFRRKHALQKRGTVTSNDITGTFTIDPALRIPMGLLDALRSPLEVEARTDGFSVHRSMSEREQICHGAPNQGRTPFGEEAPEIKPSSVSRSTSTKIGIERSAGGILKQRGRGRGRHNLRLEVENGGIDIDVHLVPSNPRKRTSDGGRRGVSERRGSVRRSVACGGGGSFRGPGQGSRYYRSSTIRRSQRFEVPTTIDLRLKEPPLDDAGRTGKRDHANPKEAKPSLVARIDAPNPRRSFHLFASTIPVPSLSSTPRVEGETPNGESSSPNARLEAVDRPATDAQHQDPQSVHKNQKPPSSSNPRTQPQKGAPSHRRILTRPQHPSSSCPSTFSSSLTLHLPRTFRGPLTIHVQAGNIDSRVCLSKGMGAASVVLRESAVGRGYFVGGLRSPDTKSEPHLKDLPPDEADKGPHAGRYNPNSMSNSQVCSPASPHILNRHLDHGDHAPSSPSSESDSTKREGSGHIDAEEWHGDRVDVVVGDGRVYLQFVGEEDPYGAGGGDSGKLGFWGRMGFGRRCR